MSPARINRPGARRKRVRVTFAVKPVSLPTFSFYGFMPVIYTDGELVIGRRVIPIGKAGR